LNEEARKAGTEIFSCLPAFQIQTGLHAVELLTRRHSAADPQPKQKKTTNHTARKEVNPSDWIFFRVIRVIRGKKSSQNVMELGDGTARPGRKSPSFLCAFCGSWRLALKLFAGGFE